MSVAYNSASGGRGVFDRGVDFHGYLPAGVTTNDLLIFILRSNTGTTPTAVTNTTTVYAAGGLCVSYAFWVPGTTLTNTGAFTGAFGIAHYKGVTGVTGAGAASLTAPGVAAPSADAVAARIWSGYGTASGGPPDFTYAPVYPPSGQTQQTFGDASPYPNFCGYLLADAVAPSGTAVASSTATSGYLGLGQTSVTLLLAGIIAPNSPIPTSPANATVLDVSVTNRFAWTYSGCMGDTQSALDLRYSSNGGSTWTVVHGVTAAGYVDVATSTFTDGTSYQWQVRTYGSTGLVGPYSSSNFFTASAPTNTPTITAPASPVVSSPAAVTWTVSAQSVYQVRTVADASGSPDPSWVYYDTGLVTDSTIRSVSVPFPTNGQTLHIQVRVVVGGLYSVWADALVTVAYETPYPPLVALTFLPDDAAVQVAFTNRAAGGSYVDAVANDLYRDGVRIAAGLALNASYTDLIPPSGDVTYVVVAIASSGSTAPSG